MKVAICGLVNSENLGEKFISTSLAWIINQAAKNQMGDIDLELIEVDIEAKNDKRLTRNGFLYKRVNKLVGYRRSGVVIDLFMVTLKLLARKLPLQKSKNLIFRIRHYIWQHSYNYRERHKRYFEDKFKDVAMIVIDGAGLLEYSYNEYQEPLLLICKYADMQGIPVVFNAIGRAGEFNITDFRCKILKQALSMKCVKYVSARDSVENVQMCVAEGIKVKLLADAAFCLNLAFNVSLKESKVIGIGLIRGSALQSYNSSFNEEDWINLFCGIANELQARGYRFQFFTNGMQEDYSLGKKLIAKLGLSESYLVERPLQAKELLNTISGYAGLITCRMHSSIAAFTMGIPSIVLSWNDKVDKYMNIVGYPQRAIQQRFFNAAYIVDALEQALIEGISKTQMRRMREKAQEGAKEYVRLLF